MRPHIRAVVSDVDGNVAHDTYATTSAMTFQVFPLSEEIELCELVKVRLGRQFFLPLLQHRRVPLSYSRIPMHPRHVLVGSLARHEKGIVVQPFDIFLAKSIVSAPIRLGTVRKKCFCGLSEERLFEVGYAIIVDALLRKARSTGEVLIGQKSLLAKGFQI